MYTKGIHIHSDFSLIPRWPAFVFVREIIWARGENTDGYFDFVRRYVAIMISYTGSCSGSFGSTSQKDNYRFRWDTRAWRA